MQKRRDRLRRACATEVLRICRAVDNFGDEVLMFEFGDFERLLENRTREDLFSWLIH